MQKFDPSSDRGRSTIAMVLIGVGVVFLIGQIFHLRIGHVIWPFFFIVPGVGLLIGAFARERANPGLAAPGAVLTATGVIFLYQSISGHWESWAYIWALYPVAVGLAMIAVGTRNGDEPMVAQGQQSARWGAIAFLVGVVFFELLIFNRGGFAGYLIPVALIVAGGFILYRQNNREGGWSGFGGSAMGSPPPPPPPPPPMRPMTPAPGPVTPAPVFTPPSPPAAPFIAPRPSGPTVAVPPSAPAAAIVTPPPAGPIVTPPPATPIVTPPPAAPIIMPPPAPPVASLLSEPFPAAEIPSPPAPDSAPFPVDDGTTEAPAATRKPRAPRKPKSPGEGGEDIL